MLNLVVAGMNFLSNFVNLLMISPYHSHLILLARQSHQFIMSFITTFIIHHSSLALRAQNFAIP